MTDAQREVLLSPTAADRVQIAGADSAGLNLDIDIVIAKGLGGQLVLVELGPLVGILDLETDKLLGDAHDCCFVCFALRWERER